MADRSYAEAVYRRYLIVHPEHAAGLAALSAADREAMLRAWPQTFEGQRHMLADDLDRLADEDPSAADALRAKAHALRAGHFTAP